MARAGDDVDDGAQSVVLVDHNNPDQMPGDLGKHLGRVVGVFDHHNIQPEFASKVIRTGATRIARLGPVF